MKLQDVKTDFHVTGWVSENPPEIPVIRDIVDRLEPFPKTLLYIADTLYSPNENRAIFLLNYNLPKYQRIVRDLGEVERAGYEVHSDYRDVFVGLTRNRKTWLYVVHGVEALTDKGHVMIGAMPQSMLPKQSQINRGPKLEERLREAKDNDALIIPTHPLLNPGFFGRIVLRLLREPSGIEIGMNKDNLKKYARFFDAIESYSLSMSPEQTERVVKLASELDVPTVTNTDGKINGALSSYTLFPYIDFSSPESMRQSYRNALRQRKHSEIQPEKDSHSRILDILEHIAVSLFQDRRNF